MKTFAQLDQPTARYIHLGAESYLFFGGTAYLGLLVNPAYIALFKEGMDRYGLNNGTSRANNVQLGVYDETERHLARRFGFEDSAVFSSGYLAVQAGVRALTPGKKVYYAPNTHPALWIADNPQVYGTFEEWIATVVAEIKASDDTNIAIVSNTLDNLTPEIYGFSLLKEIGPDKKITLLLDDSHGIGVLYKNKTSVDLDYLHQPNIDVVILASMAKGLGTDAGMILGSKEVISEVKKHPIFVGGSPPPPAAMYAMLHGQQIYEQAFEILHRNLRVFNELISPADLRNIPSFPVYTSAHVGLYKELLKKHIVISSFPYPLPTSPLLNRVVISALHKEEDLVALHAAIDVVTRHF